MLPLVFFLAVTDGWKSNMCLPVYETSHLFCITKACLYNFDPLKPHFYVVKLGFTGVYNIFVISAQKHRLWVLNEAVLRSTHNLCFDQKYEKYQNFLSEELPFFGGKIFSVFE